MNRGWLGSLVVSGAAMLALAAPALAGSSWRIVPSPNPPGNNDGQLNATVVTGAADAWAAGFGRVGNGTFGPLIAHWAGQSWTIVPSASVPASHTVFLNGLAATGPSDVWAVGSDSSSSATRSVAEHWNGGVWTRAAAPAGEPAGSTLTAVSAHAPADVWAVGYSRSPSTLAFAPLIEHFDGSTWSVVNGSGAYPASIFNRLETVAAIGPRDVWALGVTGRHPDPVFEHFNGSTWSVVAQPANGYDTVLDSISAVSSSDIWAVGGTDVSNTLVEHWNGRAWSIVPSPSVTGPGSVTNTLTGVSALGTSNVWAVGTVLTNGSAQSTLTEHWDGAKWTIAPSPSPKPSAGLNSVSGLPAGPLFAVGFGDDSAGTQSTLILQH
jgi:hypothetical protein